VADGIWVVHTSDRAIVKLDVESGAELDRVVVPDSDPQPHGLSIFGEDLIYCDAASGWVAKINL
ncbi:MAG: hypothetical protein OXM01_03050, partial [Gemmatimonadota bacterium]|nr:hypothetical protein [Gemmatimonadota bacterium]